MTVPHRGRAALRIEPRRRHAARRGTWTGDARKASPHRGESQNAETPDRADRANTIPWGGRRAMSRDFDERFPRFHIGPYDRVTIEGVAFTLAGQTDAAFILAPAEGGGLPQTFPFAHLNRLNAAGKVRHEPEHFLPASQRRAAAAALGRVSGLPAEPGAEGAARHPTRPRPGVPRAQRGGQGPAKREVHRRHDGCHSRGGGAVSRTDRRSQADRQGGQGGRRGGARADGRHVAGPAGGGSPAHAAGLGACRGGSRQGRPRGQPVEARQPGEPVYSGGDRADGVRSSTRAG